MKKFFNKRLGTVLLCVACVAIIASTTVTIFFARNRDADQLPVSYAQGSYSYEVGDPQLRAGFFDYVFVGQVVRKVRTEQAMIDTLHDDVPYTYYEVKVLENLKGNLKLGSVEIEKWGGVSSKGISHWFGLKPALVVESGDYLPHDNDVCLFYAGAEEDGRLTSFGAFSTILLSGDNATSAGGVSSAQADRNSWERLPEFQEALAGCENPVEPYERDRYVAAADAANAD